MQDLAIFAIGQQRSRWLSARIATVAQNIANADTPGFKARDISPFESELQARHVEMRRTQPLHIEPEPGSVGSDFMHVPRSGTTSKHSGNTVNLELEMASLGDARSQHSAVMGILGAFHRMLLSGTRG